MSDKPKVMLSVLCQAERTGWINPFLFDSLMALQLDGRFSLLNVMAYGIDRVEVARNRCVQYARDTGAEHLVMIDNDQTLPPILRSGVSNFEQFPEPKY